MLKAWLVLDMKYLIPLCVMKHLVLVVQPRPLLVKPGWWNASENRLHLSKHLFRKVKGSWLVRSITLFCPQILRACIPTEDLQTRLSITQIY